MKRNYSAPRRGGRIFSRGLASGATVTPGMRVIDVCTPEGCKESSHPSGVQIEPLNIDQGLRTSRLPLAILLAPLRGAE